MLDDDLEVARFGPQLSGWHSAFRGVNFLEASNKSAARPIEDGAEKHEHLPQDDSVVRVPRQKVEQLMRLWIDVFHDFSRTKPEDPESSMSVILPNVQGPCPFSLDGVNSSTPPPSAETCADQTSCRHIVDVMSESEVEVENERRRRVRTDWRPDEKCAYLEDCWKHLWVFQWSYPDEKRKALQLALVDALNAHSGIMIVELYMRKDFRSIAPWMSLIGLRLNQIYRRFYTTVSAPGITPATQIEVLIECLWCCNSFVPRLDIPQDWQGPTIGNVLSSCYRRRILCQPAITDELSETMILREHFRLVRTALYLLNTLYKHHPPRFEKLESLDRTWNLLLSSAEASMRETPGQLDFERAKDTFFRLDDFNLKDLQNLGHLQVQWTSYWDEHLELETSSTANILKIYWFQPSLAQYLVHSRLCTKIEYGERQRREKEICATWSILFTSNCTEKKSRQCYEKLKAPKWLSLLAQSELDWGSEQALHEVSETDPDLSGFTGKLSASKYCFETRDHLMFQWSEPGKVLHERISFSQFPIYGDRLRALRAYMDAQQPKGLRALWRDRRNSNTYYTFWFVVIFGSLSVFLATCALAVSIAQTWAAFHTMKS